MIFLYSVLLIVNRTLEQLNRDGPIDRLLGRIPLANLISGILVTCAALGVGLSTAWFPLLLGQSYLDCEFKKGRGLIMRRRLIPVIIVLLFTFAAASNVSAYDPTTVHFGITYALARMAGFSDEESALIDDASRSVDENNSTTAFSYSLLLHESAGALQDDDKLDYLRNLPHPTSGQLFHALSSNRDAV